MLRPPSIAAFLPRAALCAAVTLAGFPPPAFAQDEPAAGASASVSMRFFNAPWADVLARVADESGSKLVMKDTPPGRFSRFDRAAYTRREAVRMLNRELEPEGFRVFEEGDALVVIHGRSVRENYRRPVAPDTAGRRLSPPDHGAARVEPQDRTRKFGSVMPKRDEHVRTAGRRTNAGDAGPSLVTTADLTDGGPSPVFPAGDEAAAPAGPTPAERLAAADAAPAKTVTVRVGRGKAKAVALTLLNAVKPHDQVVDRGPGGLPAFEAYRPPAGGGEQLFAGRPVFTVGVDEGRDELVVTAPGDRADRVAAALKKIDAGPPAGQAQRVVVGTPATARVGGQLAPVVAKLALARRQDGRQQPPQPNQPNQPNQQPNPQPGGEAPGQPASPNAPNAAGIIDNLRSEVQIEELGDTGVLLLRGNEDDLDAIQRVIDQIEALSAGLQPQIQLFLLQHVDSVPMAALLTEVYTELERVRNRGEQSPSRVTVLPVGRPNAVIVIASETDLVAVERLAEQIDQPVAPGAQVEVFRLTNSIPSQVADAINNFSQTDAQDDDAPFPLLEAFPDVRTNSVIVRGAPNGLKLAAKLVADLDAGTSELVTRVEIVDLDFAVAEELAETINAAIQGIIDPSQRQAGQLGGGFGGGGGEQRDALQVARSVIVEYITATGQRERTGLLADASVAAEAAGNRLILTAPEKTMPLLIALVAALDSPSGARADVKAFTLQSADAETAVEILRELFEVDGDNPTGVTLEGTADAGSNLVPLRFSADPRTRTVLAIGGEDALAIVEAILLRLDDENRNKQRFFSVKLVNAPAELVATSIAGLIDARRTLLGEVPGLLSPVELIERNVVVIPEPFTNRLLIFADDGSRDEVLQLIREIDEAPPQVAIQALLVEVTLDNTDEFGVELGVQDSTLFSRSNTGADGANPFAFNNTNPLGQLPINPSALATQGISNLGLGRTNADLGIGGFVLSASSENVSILLRALQAKRQVHVLSRPQVTVVDQQTAEINVGQTVPVLAGITIGLGQTTPTIERVPSGLTLRVTPRISPDGTVFMQVGAQNNNFILTGVPVFTDAQTGTTFNSPIENVSRTETSVSVPNGQTVVLGGIITDSEAVNERKVPYLGDIPYVGQLFRTDTTVKTRSELLVFLTPRIIYTDADFELVKQVEADRIHYLEHEAEAIHGPLFGVPPEPGVGGYAPGGIGPAGVPPGAFGGPAGFENPGFRPPAPAADPFAAPR